MRSMLPLVQMLLLSCLAHWPARRLLHIQTNVRFSLQRRYTLVFDTHRAMHRWHARRASLDNRDQSLNAYCCVYRLVTRLPPPLLALLGLWRQGIANGCPASPSGPASEMQAPSVRALPRDVASSPGRLQLEIAVSQL